MLHHIDPVNHASCKWRPFIFAEQEALKTGVACMITNKDYAAYMDIFFIIDLSPPSDHVCTRREEQGLQVECLTVPSYLTKHWHRRVISGYPLEALYDPLRPKEAGNRGV